MKTEKTATEETVKFKQPLNEEEAALRFKVVNYNEVTKRVYIELINTSMYIKPQQLVSIEDIIKA